MLVSYKTMTEQQNLTDRLRQKIQSSPEKYMTFAEYMEHCLYHPEYGYYMKPSLKIGKQGDFYTSSSVHPVFAEMFVEMAVEASKAVQQPITILEIGAGTGAFAAQFLSALQAKYTEEYEKCEYKVLEISLEHIKQQKSSLAAHGGLVQWLTDLKQCQNFKGIVITNELFDAFPVHLVQERNGQIEEIAVTWSDEKQGFVEQYIAPTEQVLAYIQEYRLDLHKDQRIEIPCAAAAWMREFAPLIRDGLWYIIDYGYTHQELGYPQHRQGSLICYYKHQMDELPLENPGAKDITYHIHFDSLADDASKAGWVKEGLFPQHQFLLQAGILKQLTDHAGGDPFRQEEIRKNRAIRHFISPEGISGSFKVLVLTKGSYADQSHTFSFVQPFSFI